MLPRSEGVNPSAGLFLALCTTFASAQAQEVRVKAGVDPYTKGEAAALEKAGYESLGPFSLGQNHTTITAENLLGTEPLMWVETAHFRLGCALPAIATKGREEWSKEWKARLDDELDVLRERIPDIKKRVKVLDPWLRTHLMALRLENLYAEVLDVLGREADWFPTEADDPRTPEKFRGLGPFFGMKEKFVVLLLQKGSSHARYTGAFLGFEQDMPIRYHDHGFGAMYWGASEETANNLYRIDHALHTNMVFNVSHNLYTCYRAFGHDLPPWLVTGLAHWHARQISPRFPTYDRRDETDRDERSPFWDWETRVKGLVKHEVFEPFDKFLARDDAGAFGLEQHMQAWAVVDFLLDTRKSETTLFVNRLKDPFHGRLRMPSKEELQKRQQDAFAEAFACEIPELQEAFVAYVLDKKRRRRRE